LIPTPTTTSSSHNNRHKELSKKPWYQYLLTLWYLVSFGIAALFILALATDLSTGDSARYFTTNAVYPFFAECIAIQIFASSTFILAVTTDWRFFSNKACLVVFTGLLVICAYGLVVIAWLFGTTAFLHE